MSAKNHNITVCFDVDGTLIHQNGSAGMPGSLEDTPRYDVISFFLFLEKIGCTMFIWSGGGIDYATRWRDKLGLVRATVVAKGSFTPDLAIDDMDLSLVAAEKALGKVTLQV